jgi:hypothetical protein
MINTLFLLNIKSGLLWFFECTFFSALSFTITFALKFVAWITVSSCLNCHDSAALDVPPLFVVMFSHVVVSPQTLDLFLQQ